MYAPQEFGLTVYLDIKTAEIIFQNTVELLIASK